MRADIAFNRPSEGALEISLSGSWTFSSSIPDIEKTILEIGSSQRTQRVSFRSGDITGWDSSLLVFLTDIYRHCSDSGIQFDDEGLPPGITRLLKLAFSVPPQIDARSKKRARSLLMLVGSEMVSLVSSAGEMLDFLGQTFIAFTKIFVGKARFSRSDLLFFIQECGHEAVPIVSLISALVGLILAFTGAVQLLLFGAQIYVASLVGISMVRVMGAIMVGIIMAGRTGAAYAAQLGTMQVNEEIDAFRTLGISPIEFLVLPRVLALTIMMPLLCIYADLMGILGGLIVGMTMLDLNAWEYLNMTRQSVALVHFWIGLAHAAVFGVLVSMAGCLRGMQCGRSSQAVGAATTSAVVTGIVSIIIATAVITIICNVLGI